jgi:putative membrane-bound dehydrogenase-like protein
MIATPRLAAACLLLIGSFGARACLPGADGAPTPKLFDGVSLAGWEGSTASWRVDGGVIIGEIASGAHLERNEFLFSTRELHDFELTVEYRITGLPSANSGIQYRSARRADGEAVGYQADLDDGATWLGRVYEENGRAVIAERGTRVSIAPDGRRFVDAFATPDSFRPGIHANDWNTYHLRVAASHSELWINGILFSALDDHQVGAAAYGGRIAFQLHAGDGPSKIEFRNLHVLELGTSEGPSAATAAANAPAGAQAGIQVLGDDGKPLNLGFETGTLEGWNVEGNAWDGQPIKGDTVSPRKPGQSSNHVGSYWLGGYEKVGDQGTGTLTSATFTVTHPWASFLIGGGRDSTQTRLELVDAKSGTVFHTAAGEDSESMRRVAVDLTRELGKHIFIRIIDQGTGGWGHINYDDFVFHDQAPTVAAARAPSGRQNDSPVLWHLEPNPARPTTVACPEAQTLVAGMMLTHGFQAELIAAEPEVRQPIAFTFDSRGRMWVAEAYCYPNRQPEGKGTDRITIFEDVDGDGSFRKRSVFIEGLNLVSGLAVGCGGVFVGAAPQLLFIPDRNHDDIPDGPPEVLLDGFGLGDTHETLNSLTFGPDGWLYGNQGVFNSALIGKPGTPNDQRVPMHAGVWRFHPLRHEFEIFASGGSNQWGLDFNEVGHLFITHCRSFWGGGGTSYVVRNGYYWNQVNANYAPFISNAGIEAAPGLKNFLLASSRYDDGEGGAGKPGSGAIFGGHAHVGTLIYLGDNWPDIYRDHVFTNNIFGAQMNHQENVRQGSGYETLHAGYDMMWVPDPHYLAVNMLTGPDGAVYMIDWCDLQHCHTPDHEKWDRSNGRIYRISYAKTYKPRKVDLSVMSDVELVAAQSHHNDWFCRAARLLLQERAQLRPIDAKALQDLHDLLSAGSAPALTLRALWCLHVIGKLDQSTVEQALHDKSDAVRGWAIQLATERPAAFLVPVPTLAQLAAQDPSAAVRLAIASVLPLLHGDDLWSVAEALAAHPEDADDRYLPKMIWFGIARACAADAAPALALAQKTPLVSLADSIRWFCATQPKGREPLLATFAAMDDAGVLKTLKLMSFALRSEAAVPMPANWPAQMARINDHGPAEARQIADQLSVQFGDQQVLARTRAKLADEKTPPQERRSAFELLKRSGDPQAGMVFITLLDAPQYRSEVIPLLSRSSEPAIASALLKRYASFSEPDRASALNTLTSRAALAAPLLAAVQDGSFDKKQLSALRIRQLRSLNDAAIDRILDQSWGKISDPSASAKVTIARLKKAYQEAPLWAYSAEHGKEIFQRTCTICHSLNGVGGKIGPDLGGSWRNGVDYFLENIIDPNAVVGEDYQLHVITKKDGSVVSGLLEKETETTVVIRSLADSTPVPKSEIKEHQKLAQSMMPPGLLESLPEKDALELLKFLTSKN